jgi:ribosomal-protein-alanine N-acetyltransferase
VPRVPYPESLGVAGARLQRWDAERDLEVIEALRADPEVTRFLSFLLERDLAQMSAAYEQHWDEYGHGLWAVRLPDGGPAGWCGAVHPRWHPEMAHEVELAWGLVSSAWGKGIATRGARACAEACFTDVGLERTIVFIDPTNARSHAVATRLGARPTGTTILAHTGETLEVLHLTPADLP